MTGVGRELKPPYGSRAGDKQIPEEEIKPIRDRLTEAFPQRRETLSARAFIAELAPDIKRALKNRYTLDQIAEKISQFIAENNKTKPKSEHITISPLTIRGYRRRRAR
jgi:hypothetical protein